MGPAAAMIVVRLIDLALAGGEWAIRAKQARDRLNEMAARGGPTKVELDALGIETDDLLDKLKTSAARNAGV